LLLLAFALPAIANKETPHMKNAAYRYAKNYTPEPKMLAGYTSNLMPFTRAGKLIIIKAVVDSIEGNFILDTGAPHLILNQTYFRNYAATRRTDEHQMGITGAGANVLTTNIDRVQFGNFEYADCEADLVNLGHLEDSKGIKILGLIGMALLQHCEMVIDFENNTLDLTYISRKQMRGYKSKWMDTEEAVTTIPISLNDHRIMVNTEMDGKKLQLIIDSGAETNIMDSKMPKGLIDNLVVTGRVLLAGTGSKKIEAVTADLANMKIGNATIGTLPVVVTNLEKTCFYYDGCIDGILGFEYLSLKKLAFNFVHQKMYLWK
jgi:predicted aspartyl protease